MSVGTLYALTLLTNGVLAVGGGVLCAYAVRFVVRRIAPHQDASFGAFCFMLAAFGMHGDFDDRSPHYAVEAAKALGFLAALPLIWWLWFRRKPGRADAVND